MKSPSPIKKHVSKAPCPEEQSEQMQRIRNPAGEAISANDDASDPWAIVNRVCDRYHIPRATSTFQASTDRVIARL
jgi:hypothetical protein